MSSRSTPAARLATLAWAALGLTVAVSVWGALVRATGSGAGCGSHWPLCDGAVLPDVGTTATLIEFTHRVTSGLALLLVVGLAVAVWRSSPRGAPARWWALASVTFMFVEAAIGAGLVLLELVGENTSVARAVVMGAHLINTFALVGALTLTAWALSEGRVRWPGGRAGAVTGACIAALLLTSVSGAVAALGDTLFPAESLFEAWRQELSATSNILIRLRLLHPVLAVATAGGVAAAVSWLSRSAGGPTPLSRAVVALLALQLAAGAINVLLLAPVWMQLVHLALANAVWIAFVLVAADADAASRSAGPEDTPPRRGAAGAPSERAATAVAGRAG